MAANEMNDTVLPVSCLRPAVQKSARYTIVNCLWVLVKNEVLSSSVLVCPRDQFRGSPRYFYRMHKKMHLFFSESQSVFVAGTFVFSPVRMSFPYLVSREQAETLRLRSPADLGRQPRS